MSADFDAVKLYFAAALVDGEVQEEEKTVLFDVAQRHGLSMSEISEMWVEAKTGQTGSVSIPKDASTRAKIFENLLKIVLADDVVSDREIAFLEKLSKVLQIEHLLEANRKMIDSKRG